MWRAELMVISLLMLLAGCGGKPAATHTGTSAATDPVRQIVDALYLAQGLDSATRRDCWKFIMELEPDDQPNRTATEYLRDSSSPLYNPPLLDEYLLYLLATLPDSDLRRERVDYLLDCTRKNRPGQTIADLDLLTADGRHTSLHREINADAYVLFYDPDCIDCSAMIDELGATDAAVIAISITDSIKPLPPRWLSARALDPDQLDDRFYLPTLPALYPVGSDAVLKQENLSLSRRG